MTIVADITDSSLTAVRVAHFTSHGRLGRHPAPIWQTFAVIDGSGWVAGGDGEPRPIAAGQAAIWEPGEEHESGTRGAMVAVIVESAAQPTLRG